MWSSEYFKRNSSVLLPMPWKSILLQENRQRNASLTEAWGAKSKCCISFCLKAEGNMRSSCLTWCVSHHWFLLGHYYAELANLNHVNIHQVSRDWATLCNRERMWEMKRGILQWQRQMLTNYNPASQGACLSEGQILFPDSFWGLLCSRTKACCLHICI